jgi:hypothetical protein
MLCVRQCDSQNCFGETKSVGLSWQRAGAGCEYKKLRKSGKAFTFPPNGGLLSMIFLFFIERVEASPGLDFFGTFCIKTKSTKCQ